MEELKGRKAKKDLELMSRRNQLVVKDNDLIQKTQFALSAQQQKLVCYVISLIKPTDKVFEEYTIDILDFAELCGISQKNVYTEFKRMIDDLDSKATWVKFKDTTFKFRWFSEAKYIENQGKIKVLLNSEIKKYLLELSHSFTQYELYNILAFKSKWSIRLYELFKSYQYQHTKTFTVDELRELLGAETYSNYGSFKQRVLDKAQEEINKYSDITIKYQFETVGRGRKVTEITIIIEKKEQLDSFLAYRNTIDKLNEKNKQIKGQLSIFDKDF